jgi:two-component sensor histidine kinase
VPWSVTSTEAAARSLRLRWAEMGGPPATLPERRRFGSRLVEHGLKQDLSGEVRIEFAPTGVICTCAEVTLRRVCCYAGCKSRGVRR